jgi:hypothetical protein
MLRTSLLLLAALPLAACDGGNGTSITIDAKTDGDNTLVSTDQNGQMSIKAEGFEGSIKLPKIAVTAENLDLDGIALYPDAKVHDIHVESNDKLGERDKGSVRLSFDAPASLAKVQAWFRDDLAKQGASVSGKDSGFRGTTKDGDPFSIALEADGADKTKGTMTLENK